MTNMSTGRRANWLRWMSRCSLARRQGEIRGMRARRRVPSESDTKAESCGCFSSELLLFASATFNLSFLE